MTPEEIINFNNQKTNNWAFTQSVVDTLIDFKQTDDTVWDWRVSEVARAQMLLSLYKTAFDLTDNKALFEHIKNKKCFENNFDYAGFQQYLVESWGILQERIVLGHKKPNKQYMRDKYYFILEVQLHNRVYKKYIPDTPDRNLVNLSDKISRYALSNAMSLNAKNKDKTMREGLLNEITSNPDFFKGCRDMHSKLTRIRKASAKYPRKNEQKLPISEKTARRYLAEIERKSDK